MDKIALKPKILHKGLALVVIPLLLECILFFQLYSLISQAEELAEFERKQSSIVTQINKLMTLFAYASGTMATSVLTGNKSQGTAARRTFAEVSNGFSDLEQQVADNPPLATHFARMRELTEQEFATFEQMNPVNSGTSFGSLLMRVQELKPFIKQTSENSKAVSEILEGESVRLKELREREAASRRRVKDMVLVGIMLNVALAVVLVLLFIKDITGRLRILVENAQRLPQSLPLDKSVPGTDELAYLDKVLHDAAAALHAAAEHRQSLMEMVAHDLRAPLMSSQVAVEILARDLGDVSKAQKPIDALTRNIGRLVNLVNDLLTIDKLEAGKLELELARWQAHALAEESIQAVVPLAKQKNIELVNACGQEIMHVDKARIQQVLINFLSNAIKFSPEQSTITIASAADGNGKGTIMSIADQGPGLSSEDQNKLFQKFYQTKSGKSEKGFGLGLAICKLIVESHEGKVGVESKLGQGCKFWFSIP